jgi:hypothetical protein
MTQHRDGSLEKSARLIILMRAEDKGRLTGLSLQKIANLFPQPPNRSTIMRDLRDLKNLRTVLRKMER